MGGGFLSNCHPPPQTISEGGNAELFQMRGPCRLIGEVTIGMFGEPGDHMRRQRPFAGFSARPSRALDRHAVAVRIVARTAARLSIYRPEAGTTLHSLEAWASVYLLYP